MTLFLLAVGLTTHTASSYAEVRSLWCGGVHGRSDKRGGGVFVLTGA
jgi:hypothetical protein